MSEVFNEDNMVGMARYADKYFDLAIVDPPYGIDVNMNMGKKKGEKARYEKKKWDKNIPDITYFKELFRVSKNQIVFGGNYFAHLLPPSMGWICWDKAVPDGVSFSDFELAWSSFNIAAVKVILPYCGFIGLDKKRIHPTEKPVKLYDWVLKNYAKSGDKIIDTHLGSGNSRIAADGMGFDFVGFDDDVKYFEAHEKRFKEYKSQTKLFQL